MGLVSGFDFEEMEVGKVDDEGEDGDGSALGYR